MKKKIVAAMLVLTFVLAGCGSNEKVITGDATAEVAANNENNAEAADTQAAQAVGFTFTSKGVDINVYAEAAPIVEALGEPQEYFEAPSCAFGDMDKTYTYSGFELDTYAENDTDYVSMVILKDDSVSTNEGVSIGSTLADVKSAYGEPDAEDGDMLVYKKDDMKLAIQITNDSVSSIQYLNTILD